MTMFMEGFTSSLRSRWWRAPTTPVREDANVRRREKMGSKASSRKRRRSLLSGERERESESEREREPGEVRLAREREKKNRFRKRGFPPLVVSDSRARVLGETREIEICVSLYRSCVCVCVPSAQKPMCLNLFFTGWTLDTEGKFVGACVGVLLLGVLRRPTDSIDLVVDWCRASDGLLSSNKLARVLWLFRTLSMVQKSDERPETLSRPRYTSQARTANNPDAVRWGGRHLGRGLLRTPAAARATLGVV